MLDANPTWFPTASARCRCAEASQNGAQEDATHHDLWSVIVKGEAVSTCSETDSELVSPGARIEHRRGSTRNLRQFLLKAICRDLSNARLDPASLEVLLPALL